MNDIHPTIAAALAPFAPPPLSDAQARRQQYEAALRNHDWSFEWSDDGDVVRRGRESLERLKQQRSAIDPKGTIWNCWAPVSHRFPVSELA